MIGGKEMNNVNYIVMTTATDIYSHLLELRESKIRYLTSIAIDPTPDQYRNMKNTASDIMLLDDITDWINNKEKAADGETSDD
jgi:hypothetical protein